MKLGLVFFTVSAFVACEPVKMSKTLGEDKVITTYPNEDWQQAEEGTLKFNEELRSELYNELEKRPDIHTMLVIKDGKIIDDYGMGMNNNETIRSLNSMTKSVISILIGMAIQDGYIESVHQSVEDFIPEIKDYEQYEKIKKITIRDLLTMRSGIEWGPKNETARAGIGDTINYVFTRPIIRDPDVTFTYNSGGSDILSIIIERAVGKDTASYAEERLFQPLTIDNYYWEKHANTYYIGGRGLQLTPTNLARIGYLMLNDGVWENERLLPQGWVKESTTSYSSGGYLRTKGYGYQWWIGESNGEEYYFAAGGFGQTLFVHPEKDLVVVFTGRILDHNSTVYYTLLRNYIFKYLE